MRGNGGGTSTPSTSFQMRAIRPFHDAIDVLLVDERHLDVDLRELGLAVEAQILVAEAAHDLEVAIEAGDHEELLEDLRRLGERVEVAGVEPRRHEEVARAARRVLHHERRLELEEAVRVEVVARGAVELRAHEEVLLQRRAAQIEVAVLEAHRLAGVGVVADRERRRLGAREDVQPGRLDLDLAGRQLGVDVVAARDDAAGDADAELGAQLAGERVRLGVDVGAEDDLGDAAAIAQIDEDAAAVIAARGDPAHEDDLAVADVGGAQVAATVGALQLDEEARSRAQTCGAI